MSQRLVSVHHFVSSDFMTRSICYIKQDNQNALEMWAYFTLEYKLRPDYTCSFLFHYYMCRSCKLCDLIVDCHVLCSMFRHKPRPSSCLQVIVGRTDVCTRLPFLLLTSLCFGLLTINIYKLSDVNECCQFCINFLLTKYLHL